MRFSLATGASLLFPFAPHACADIYDLLTGQRVWEQPWPQAEEAMLESDSLRAGLPGQRQGPRPRPGPRRRRRGGRSRRSAGPPPNVRAHLDGSEIVKEIVVPGKLVNFVVR